MKSRWKLRTATALFAVLFLSGCSKKYQYVERSQNSKSGKVSTKKIFFYSKKDEDAYLEGYSKFRASVNVNDFSKRKMRDDYTHLLDFQVYDAGEKNITHMAFEGREQSEKEIERKFSTAKIYHQQLLSESDRSFLEKNFSVQNVDAHTQFYISKKQDRDSLFYVYMREKDGALDGLRMRFTKKRKEFAFPKEVVFYTDKGYHSVLLTSSLAHLKNNIEGFDEDLLLNRNLLNDLMQTDSLRIELSGTYGMSEELFNEDDLSEVRKMIGLFLQHS